MVTKKKVVKKNPVKKISTRKVAKKKGDMSPFNVFKAHKEDSPVPVGENTYLLISSDATGHDNQVVCVELYHSDAPRVPHLEEDENGYYRPLISKDNLACDFCDRLLQKLGLTLKPGEYTTVQLIPV